MTEPVTGREKIRVVVADDHPVVRHGLRSMLELNPRIEVSGEVADGAELVRRVEELNPDVVLVDLRMPGMGGIEAARRIARSGSPSRLVALTAYDEEEFMLEAVRAGIHGYLLKEIDAEALNSAIEAVAQGEMVLDPRVGRSFVELLDESVTPESYSSYGLTPKEEEVLRLLVQGLGNREMAERLYVSSNTLKFHLKNIYAKLGVHSRTEVIRKLG
ncbi:MAG: response regulator [Actinomycetota bacterium]